MLFLGGYVLPPIEVMDIAGILIVVVMANLQNLEQMAYSAVTDYFKLVSRQGWVRQTSVNNILVLIFAVQFWWKYSVLMEENDVQALQRLFRCLGIDCLIPSITSEMHDKVVINKRSLDSDWTVLMNEQGDTPLKDETSKIYLIPEVE